MMSRRTLFGLPLALVAPTNGRAGQYGGNNRQPPSSDSILCRFLIGLVVGVVGVFGGGALLWRLWGV